MISASLATTGILIANLVAVATLAAHRASALLTGNVPAYPTSLEELVINVHLATGNTLNASVLENFVIRFERCA